MAIRLPPLRRWSAISLALLPSLAMAQFEMYFRATKDRYFVQTSATGLSEHHSVFRVLVSPPAFPVQRPPIATMSVAGVSYSLAITNDTAFERSFSTAAEMERLFPQGNATITLVNQQNSFPTYNLATPLITIPAGAAPEPVITNFDVLQNWDGGRLTIAYKLPPVSGTIPTPTGPVTPPYNLVIWRASDIELTRDARALWAASVSGTGTVSTTEIQAAPGETLYGELQAPTIVDQNYFFSFSFLAAPAWVRFPIHRAALASPAIVTQPKSQNLQAGDTLTLSVTTTGESLSYQWRKDGADIAGASGATFEIKPAQLGDAGSYSVRVANSSGAVISDNAIIAITPRTFAPAIATVPRAQTIAAGASASFAVTATGTAPLTYQWLRNGTAIAGATQATLIIERARFSDRGQYSVSISNALGTITSPAAELTVNPVSRIANLSILTSLASASDNFTLGFVLSGTVVADASAAKPVLVRAVGPSLASLGVQGALDDPKLEFFSGSILTSANDNWAGDATLASTFTALGAFAFANAASRDAAVLVRVAISNNSIRISGTGSGLVLPELYDGTPAEDFGLASPRFANVSVLKQIGTGLTAGFVIDGAEPLRVLIRAVGPTLGGFGVSGTLPDPKLDLFQSGNMTAIASNDNWGAAANATQIASAAASVGAFALAPESKDAVLLATLAPGNYTVQVSGVGNAAGTALVEVYEVP